MSSPIAKPGKSAIDRALIAGHQRMSHGRRVNQLAGVFAGHIAALTDIPRHEPIRILDVGCGDMSLVDEVAARLGSADVHCVDVHPCPAERLAADPRWQRYSVFDGRRLQFDTAAFDVVMLSDVLHHVSPADRVDLLTEAGRVGRWVIIKDHLEYGWLSRQTLRAMDFVGNYGYGVPVPDRYFTHDQLRTLIRSAAMDVTRMDIGLDLYAHLPIARTLLSPQWQVMLVASRTTR